MYLTDTSTYWHKKRKKENTKANYIMHQNGILREIENNPKHEVRFAPEELQHLLFETLLRIHLLPALVRAP